MENNTLRYSDQDLAEFKTIIMNKKTIAQEELQDIVDSLRSSNPNGTDDTGGAYHELEDGAPTLDKEYLHQLASRQRQFIDQLDAALLRIENKSYGICRASGQLIQKERLRAVPHTTLSMEAKMRQN